MQNCLLITGGSGFIGSHFVRLAHQQGAFVVNLDAMTYAAHPDTLKDLEHSSRYVFIKGDIADSECITQALTTYAPRGLIHFAAETHVDRSIDGAGAFVKTNIQGTFTLLEAWREYTKTHPEARFLHVSTDEVYGSVEGRPFQEEDPYNPSSPYAASKAAADHLVSAYGKTYGLDTVITNCTNNYGSHQFPEKLIPHMILRAWHGNPLPLYGDGQQRRNWLHVTDHVEALWRVLDHGQRGEKYNIAGASAELTNKEVVRTICDILEELIPRNTRGFYHGLVQHVPDRPAHDRVYALDAIKIKAALGWSPRISFEEGLRQTVLWYLENQAWWQPLVGGHYTLQRLGNG